MRLELSFLFIINFIFYSPSVFSESKNFQNNSNRLSKTRPLNIQKNFPLKKSYKTNRPIDKAIHLMTYDPLGYRIDSSSQGIKNQRHIQKLKDFGFKTLIFNFRSHMVGPTSSFVSSTVPDYLKKQEFILLKNIMLHATRLGFKVALRPIVLVVGPKGEFPYQDKKKVYWWHGNIDPKNPKDWFQSYFAYHEPYLKLASEVEASWYSIGAEMHSLTTGLGPRRPHRPYGYPHHWLEFVKKAKEILGPDLPIMYGANYTDQYVLVHGTKNLGGEIEQWRQDLTQTPRNEEFKRHQLNLQTLWDEIDILGIDYYRSLGNSKIEFKNDVESLTDQLLPQALSHAYQIDQIITEISLVNTSSSPKLVYFQEVGYRSTELSFLNPAQYEDISKPPNEVHQAAAWNTFFKAYLEPDWPWFIGVGVWQYSLDEDPSTMSYQSFSPLDKPRTERVFKRWFEFISFD